MKGRKGGFRGSGLTRWLLGCIDDVNSTETETKYLVLSKVGSGLKFDEMEELREKLKVIGEIPFDQKNPPHHLKDWIDNYRYPFYYLNNNHIIVITNVIIDRSKIPSLRCISNQASQ